MDDSRPDTLPEYPQPISFAEEYDRGGGYGPMLFALFLACVLIVARILGLI